MMRASVRQKHQCLNYMRGIIPLFLVNKQYTLLTCSYKAFLSVIRKIPLMETKNIRISIILIHMAKVLLGGLYSLCKALSTGHDKTNGRFQLLTKILFSILPATFPTNPFTCMTSAPLQQMSCHCTFPRANLFAPSISMPPVDLAGCFSCCTR